MVDLLEQREVQKETQSFIEEDIKKETLDQMMGIQTGLLLLRGICNQHLLKSSLELLFVCFVLFSILATQKQKLQMI